MNNLYIGIDLGKRHDPSAIVIADVEMRRREDRRWASHYVVPFLQRLPLDTPYPDQVTQLMTIIHRAIKAYKKAHPALDPQSIHPRILVDVTGVGDAVVDLLKKEGIQRLGQLYPCRFVGGDHVFKNISRRGVEYSIGKTNFVSRLQVVAESGVIHLPPGYSEADALSKEMLDFDIDVDEVSGKTTYGAMRPGTHDDMVCALGLAVFNDPLRNVRQLGPLDGAQAKWKSLENFDPRAGWPGPDLDRFTGQPILGT